MGKQLYIIYMVNILNRCGQIELYYGSYVGKDRVGLIASLYTLVLVSDAGRD